MKVRRDVTPPLQSAHAATWELLRLPDIYASSADRDALFLRAMRENARWHSERNAAYRRFCEHHGFNPEDHLDSIEDLDRIPALAADVIKAFDLTTVRDVDLFAVTSSGTSGRRSRVPLDLETVLRMWTMGEASFDEEGLRSADAVDYVILAPDPRAHPGHGNAQFFAALMDGAPAREAVYALVADERGGFRLDLARAAAHLARCATAARPVRVLGLPALVVRLAEAFAGGAIALPADSLVLTGAGWKKDADAALSKPDVRALLQRAWGLPHPRVRDLYGMTEHAVHYLECREHSFHAPVFARVRVIDPLTGAAVPPGTEGVLHLMNPGFTTVPLHSLLTADVAVQRQGCACGRTAPAFEVIRRGGTSRFRGCAATTLERMAS